MSKRTFSYARIALHRARANQSISQRIRATWLCRAWLTEPGAGVSFFRMLPPNGRQTMIIGRRGVAGQVEGRPVRPYRGSEGGANVARVTNHFRRSDGAESSRVSRRTKSYPRAPVGRIFRLGLSLGRDLQLRRSNVLDTTRSCRRLLRRQRALSPSYNPSGRPGATCWRSSRSWLTASQCCRGVWVRAGIRRSIPPAAAPKKASQRRLV